MHHGSCAITCAYGIPLHQSSGKSESSKENTEFRRNIACPFVIRFCPMKEKK